MTGPISALQLNDTENQRAYFATELSQARRVEPLPSPREPAAGRLWKGWLITAAAMLGGAFGGLALGLYYNNQRLAAPEVFPTPISALNASAQANPAEAIEIAPLETAAPLPKPSAKGDSAPKTVRAARLAVKPAAVHPSPAPLIAAKETEPPDDVANNGLTRPRRAAALKPNERHDSPPFDRKSLQLGLAKRNP